MNCDKYYLKNAIPFGPRLPRCVILPYAFKHCSRDMIYLFWSRHKILMGNSGFTTIHLRSNAQIFMYFYFMQSIEMLITFNTVQVQFRIAVDLIIW